MSYDNLVIAASSTGKNLGVCLEEPGFELPAPFSPIYFPMGNAATGFFVTFAMLAGVVGVASVIADINHIRSCHAGSLPSAASIAGVAWTLTLLAMGSAS
ncbi:hypothetical protein F3Y22_tig00110556pilonHSYRG00315 [Hibiscus syriacus]|uniref:Uncharacterized protein n=1 Tax=Hibiscus syriacus TaxID=106335 RepID=A0A6A3A9B2_HIBSY|nr:hypothetical protein F3Y22_tig00110556pilonHSYRG00315 [Hibiscus syriacus]